MRRLLRFAHCIALLALLASEPVVSATISAQESVDWSGLVAQGSAYRSQGSLQQSMDVFISVRDSADSVEIRTRAAGELGVTLLQARRHEEAEIPLRVAYDFFTGSERGRYAVYLGNLALFQKKAHIARRYYEEALVLAGDDVDTRLSVGLNLVRLAPENQHYDLLLALSRQLDKLPSTASLARFHINLGTLARQAGSKALSLAFRHLDHARTLTEGADMQRLHVEALAALAQLYEDEKRFSESLIFTRRGIAATQGLSVGEAADLLIDLEWRAGRLHKTEGRPDAALAAWRRAVEHIESVRQDIPVEYEDGRSSFRETLQPIFLGYADLLLDQTGVAGESQDARLRSVIETIELIRQTELQDFLGDRCAVEAVEGGSVGKLPPGTAVLYPLIMPDRLELLLETSSGVERRVSAIKESTLRNTAMRFASLLRNGQAGYLASSRQLYNWLLRPFANHLLAQGIHSLIIVPDGPLRLVPFGALNDGAQYAIEKYALSMVTGLSMTNSSPAAKGPAISLIAGLSEPGEVLAKLDSTLAAQILEPNSNPGEGGVRGLIATRNLRAIHPLRSAVASGNNSEMESLKDRLALPGVNDEVKSIAAILPGISLLNAEFTVRRFSHEAESGGFRIVHIASHGVFGGSAETSFIMAHDDLLTMNGLQSLLRDERLRKNPIELLSLSACQTAEGNDRSPLGFSGAAIKARAKSVLGTLWPVEDNAARRIMEGLYGGLAKGDLSKTEALRQAQIVMLGRPDSAHPFFWAPFVLIGNWR